MTDNYNPMDFMGPESLLTETHDDFDATPDPTPMVEPEAVAASAPDHDTTPTAPDQGPGIDTPVNGVIASMGLIGVLGAVGGSLTSKVPDVYARRRMRALLLVAAIAALIVGVFVVGVPGSAPTRDEQIAAGKSGTTNARNAKANAAVSLVANDQAAAHAYLIKHKTLNGFKLKGQGVRYAAAGPTLVASRNINGTCYMYAVTAGADQKAIVDTTGAACTDKAIADAQADLDLQAAEMSANTTGTADKAFTEAANIASYYATTNWVDNQPSLTGLTSGLPQGVEVRANHGTYLDVSYGDGTPGCRKASIGSDGTVGESSPCN